ncbi:MAG: type II secretion system F family protein [Fuerstiella sp.]|nr:type II secretion system F family protein [Fuerstiella sp.]MCP4506277.1 type II secretion system F family protein [Fuerstiella sp.]
MDFSYTARNTSGAAANGVITADSVAQARQLLRGNGLFPLSLTSTSHSTVIRRRNSPRRGKKLAQTDLLLLTSQLNIMCKSGVDLADALKSAAEECANPILKNSLQVIYDDVAAGDSVSSALKKHSAIFGETYIVAIQAAEASGQMTEVLDRLTTLLRFEIRMRNTIKSILTYPVILFFVALMVSAALILFVLPQFATVFENLEKPVPPSTQFLLDISVLVRSHFMYLVPLLIVLAAGAWKAMALDSVKLFLDGLLLRMKGIGPAIQSLAAGRVFTLMGTMLQSDIPLLETLGLCRTASRNLLLQQLFGRLEDDVIQGRGIGPGLSTANCIPRGAAQMIATAERSGRLAEVIHTVGGFYEEEGERQIRQAVKFLEPAIILTMGVFVSFIVMSIMLPLLDISNVG